MGKHAYRYLYLVVDSFDEKILEEGVLLAWTNHGRYYTLIVFDKKTFETRPLANIYLVKRMTVEEAECLEETGHPCKCIPDLKERLRQRVLDAAKTFKHLNGERIDKLYKRALLAAGCKLGGG